jgi:hypothetical protein
VLELGEPRGGQLGPAGDAQRLLLDGRDVVGLGLVEGVLGEDEPTDRGGPRLVGRRPGERLELSGELGRERDPDAREPSERLERALSAVLEVRRDRLREKIKQGLRLDLDRFPVGAPLQFLDRLDLLGDAGRCDAELVETLDLVLDLLERRLGALALLLERLGLFLKDPGEPGGREAPYTAWTRRTTPLLIPEGPTATTGLLGYPFHARSPLLMKREKAGAPEGENGGFRCG